MSKKILFLLTCFLLILSGIFTEDRFTWFLETSWVSLGLVIVYLTKESFPLSKLLSILLFIHAIVLITGGFYTYEQVPIGNYIKDYFHLARNHYDRLGHFMQGFSPAILAREVFIRNSPLKEGKWLFYCSVAACLSFSAFFELIEWWVSLLYDEKANAFLGTQGDIWDTQWDMFLCLIGSIFSLICFSKVHSNMLRASSK